jgi:hypothetical protein
MLTHDMTDARPFLRWKNVEKYPKKGSHGFWIIAPCLKTFPIKKVDKITEKELEHIVRKIFGFTVSKYAEFRYQDTQGAALDLLYEPKTLPRLSEMAQRFGSSISYNVTEHGEYGTYDPESKEIKLCTPDEGTFFHELTHAGHAQIEELKPGQHPEQEVIAELVSCVLAATYGIDKKSQAWTYISNYGGRTPEQVSKMWSSVLHKVKNFLDLILQVKQ